MEAKLVLTGSMAEIAAAVAQIEATVPVSLTKGGDEVDVIKFCSLLTDDGRRAVGSLAFSSKRGNAMTRSQWQENAVIKSPQVFNGVLGSIGRAWAKVTSQPNPFVSRGLAANKEHMHQIMDKELAKRIDAHVSEWSETAVSMP